ncbi:MAG: SLC45 family MFS transporter [Anaerolineaceae bacterium]|nr:SLC45 family MFS transporter [Anaerolineaceae bacterium]
MKKFSYGKTFLLGFGFFGVSVIWSTYNAFVPLFLDGRFGLSAGWIGFFMTLDNIAGLLIQPPVGAWSDRLRTPIGRRIPFILIGAPVGALIFGLIPLASILPLFVLCTSTLLISMAFWRTPVVALMPDITPSRYRSQANGIINLMGGLGALVSFFVGSKLFDINEAYPFWLGSVLVIVSALLVFIFIKEPKEYEVVKKEDTPNLLQSMKEILQEEEKSPLRMLLAIFFWFVSYNAIEAFFTLYGVNHLMLSPGESAFQLTFLSLIFLIFAMPSGYIGAKIGRRTTIMIGLVIMAISILMLYIIPADTLNITLATIPVVGKLRIVGVILMGSGLSWALININSLPMVVDMTEDVRIGTFTGLYYMASTLAAITGPNIFGLIVQLGNNNYNLMMIFSPIFLVLALVMMAGVKRGEAKE